MSNGEDTFEEEKRKAQAETKAAEEKLKQRLGPPRAHLRYEATPSITYERMSPGWGEGL